MLFSSITFIYLFLPTVLFFYYIVFRKNRLCQNIILLLFSLLFYAWGEPKYVLIMILSIILNWCFGLLVSKSIGKKRKVLLVLDILFNLFILFVFKYLTFTGDIVNSLFGIQLPIPNILLPIGISFFTFQAMSYVIDVFNREVKAQNNVLYVALYISFFPQLIAGPIVRYKTIADQIENRKESLNDILTGLSRFVIGLSKKVLLANSFAVVSDEAFNAISTGKTISVMFGWLGAIAYTLQIFYDFSGYSDMAIGLGRLFGFHFLENFNYPYISTSVTEFWRRWHISLGSWFRDYVYFPLGGSRCSKCRNLLNLFIVWMLTGLWHGANFTFVIWGLMYFIILSFEKISGIPKKRGFILSIIKWMYTILLVVIGWVIFRADSIEDALLYLKSLFGLNYNEIVDGVFKGWFIQYIFLIIIGIILSTPLLKRATEKIKYNRLFEFLKVGVIMVLFILSVSNLVSSTYNPFIYFNF